MAEPGNENIITRTEHEEDARAKRAAMMGFDGVDFVFLKVDSAGNLSVSEPAPSAKGNIVGADGVAVLFGTPVVINVNTNFSANGSRFFIKASGNRDITMAHSDDGITFGDEILILSGESFDSELISVHSFRVTAITQDTDFNWIASP